MDKEKISDGELISMVRLRGLKPSQLYNVNSLIEDEEVKKRIETEVGFELEYRDKIAGEELNKEMEKEIEEDKLKENNNELIPGSEDNPSEEEKKRRKEIADNELIPDDDAGEPGDNELIPD